MATDRATGTAGYCIVGCRPISSDCVPSTIVLACSKAVAPGNRERSLTLMCASHAQRRKHSRLVLISASKDSQLVRLGFRPI